MESLAPLIIHFFLHHVISNDSSEVHVYGLRKFKNKRVVRKIHAVDHLQGK